jgi:hypothetical protein
MDLLTLAFMLVAFSVLHAATLKLLARKAIKVAISRPPDRARLRGR